MGVANASLSVPPQSPDDIRYKLAQLCSTYFSSEVEMKIIPESFQVTFPNYVVECAEEDF